MQDIEMDEYRNVYDPGDIYKGCEDCDNELCDDCLERYGLI